jgi:hypothetical protein
MVIDRLRAMIHMRYREVGREDRHGIAEDQVFPSIENPLLAFRELIQTEEASPPGLVF